MGASTACPAASGSGASDRRPRARNLSLRRNVPIGSPNRATDAGSARPGRCSTSGRPPRLDQAVATTIGRPQMLSALHAKFEQAVLRLREERGQGMVEYALILVLISVIVIVFLSVVGNQVNNVFSNISNGLNQ